MHILICNCIQRVCFNVNSDTYIRITHSNFEIVSHTLTNGYTVVCSNVLTISIRNFHYPFQNSCDNEI